MIGEDSDRACVSGSSDVSFGRVAGALGLFLPWVMGSTAAHAAGASSGDSNGKLQEVTV